ncbi:MAG: TetR/AcrR family transcriptional regulator [Bacteroidota bacterium]|jgi:AcrR family transcriptional regulator|nr:TetR/AcrR family transcriptional regulator [Ignavibacteria bacterium]MCU7511263.1 TetR/AcrR family transcriptional regulator [Ignavibacteria bacterium]MCU7523296.1 TetR/AcrR family transcriptional regulator [Ignavibacteria bacterium]HEX2963297.1 TetR/AcrR family transcriptional regulator [Ignavibacteriales bacterium]
MEDISKLGRKERERLQRKQEILKSAAKLFAEKGFSNATLEDIATSSEFGIGTIYNYFQNKEEIFRSIIESILNSNLEIVSETDRTTTGLIEFLKSYTRSTFKNFIDNKDELLLLVSYFTGIGEKPVHLSQDCFKDKNCQIDEVFRKRIREGIENREIRDLNPEYFYYFYHTLIFPYVVTQLKKKRLDHSNVDEHLNFVLDILFNGILNKQIDRERS